MNVSSFRIKRGTIKSESKSVVWKARQENEVAFCSPDRGPERQQKIAVANHEKRVVAEVLIIGVMINSVMH